MFQFESKGIGKLLRQGRLEVPPNQRSYAWGETRIRNLLLDLNEAVTQGTKGNEYFLGTIVLIGKEGEAPSIVDGQQRVATTTILLARIRDQLNASNRESAGAYIEETFLSNVDIKSDARVPRIKLNLKDHEFFKTQIVLKQDPDTMAKVAKEKKKSSPQLRPSNKRLVRASNLVREFVSDIVKNLPIDAAADQLIRWVEFIENNATVLVVTVPDDVSTFRMFETLNDRGLKASQADILKNYFFSKAGGRFPEAQLNWSELSNVVHSLAGDDDDEGGAVYVGHLGGGGGGGGGGGRSRTITRAGRRGSEHEPGRQRPAAAGHRSRRHPPFWYGGSQQAQHGLQRDVVRLKSSILVIDLDPASTTYWKQIADLETGQATYGVRATADPNVMLFTNFIGDATGFGIVRNAKTSPTIEQYPLRKLNSTPT